MLSLKKTSGSALEFHFNILRKEKSLVLKKDLEQGFCFVTGEADGTRTRGHNFTSS
jgi:hypothetical protein